MRVGIRCELCGKVSRIILDNLFERLPKDDESIELECPHCGHKLYICQTGNCNSFWKIGITGDMRWKVR